MKKIVFNILILISLILPIKIYSKNTVDALESIDTNKLNNITLNYSYDNQEINDVNVKIYFIASISNDFQYKLEYNFKDYNINFNEMKTNEDLNILKDTLESYIIADNIKEKESYYIKKNKVEINDLKPGLYFIKTDKVTNNKSYLIFDNILINVPNLSIDGTWDYEIDIIPKIEEKIIINEEDNPNTGDNISIYFYLLILSILGIVSLIVSFLLKRKNS